MHGKHIIHTLTDFEIYRMFNMLSMRIVERRKIGRLRIEIITASKIPNVRLNYEIGRNMSNTVHHIERNIFKVLENVPSNSPRRRSVKIGLFFLQLEIMNWIRVV